MTQNSTIVTVNAGSSSIKFALFDTTRPLRRMVDGKLERVGLKNPTLTIQELASNERSTRQVAASNQSAAAQIVLDSIQEKLKGTSPAGIGHRIVHGGPKYFAPERVTPALLAALQEIRPYDPEHLPQEILLAQEFAGRFPGVPQIACFDTDFHREMPKVAQLLPLPRRYYDQGVRRYGFHGLSYAFLLEELERVAGPQVAGGRLVLAHLGNGSSLAAVVGKKPVDTTMGFTPASGIPMSTRSGDIDPGVVWFLNRTEKVDAESWNKLVNSESGLLGLSETSGDIRDLLAIEATDERAAQAIAHFCYQIKKSIGSFAAALGGLDTLVFSGGIGENAHQIRERLCAGLGFLGIDLDAGRNARNEPAISSAESRVTVRVIRTDEETMIARNVSEFLRLPLTSEGV